MNEFLFPSSCSRCGNAMPWRPDGSTRWELCDLCLDREVEEAPWWKETFPESGPTTDPDPSSPGIPGERPGEETPSELSR